MLSSMETCDSTEPATLRSDSRADIAGACVAAELAWIAAVATAKTCCSCSSMRASRDSTPSIRLALLPSAFRPTGAPRGCFVRYSLSGVLLRGWNGWCGPGRCRRAQLW